MRCRDILSGSPLPLVSVLIDRRDEGDSVEIMHKSLDEIMRKEKFTAEEKALVYYAGQTQGDRVKVITDIKVAKANDRNSKKMTWLTFVLGFTAVCDLGFQFAAHAEQQRIPLPLLPFILIMCLGVILLLALMSR